MKKNKSLENLQENKTEFEKNQINSDINQKSINNTHTEKTIYYGEFLLKNKNSTKKERCKAILDFYKKLFG